MFADAYAIKIFCLKQARKKTLQLRQIRMQKWNS